MVRELRAPAVRGLRRQARSGTLYNFHGWSVHVQNIVAAYCENICLAISDKG